VDKKATERNRAQAQGIFVFVTTGVGTLVGAQVTGQLYVSIVEGGRRQAEAWQSYWILPAVAAGITMAAFLVLFDEREQDWPSDQSSKDSI
jgi:hypothetical protein